MENATKEQLDLFCDRTSASVLPVNRLRLLFSDFASLLSGALHHALAGTQLAHTTTVTLRLRLPRIGARVTVSMRRIKVATDTAHPSAAEFAGLHTRLSGSQAINICNFNGANGIRTRDLLLAKRLREAVNLGKEPSKFNQDCTICRPCRSKTSDSIAMKRRENCPKWRTSGPAATSWYGAVKLRAPEQVQHPGPEPFDHIYDRLAQRQRGHPGSWRFAGEKNEPWWLPGT